MPSSTLPIGAAFPEMKKSGSVPCLPSDSCTLDVDKKLSSKANRCVSVDLELNNILGEFSDEQSHSTGDSYSLPIRSGTGNFSTQPQTDQSQLLLLLNRRNRSSESNRQQTCTIEKFEIPLHHPNATFQLADVNLKLNTDSLTGQAPNYQPIYSEITDTTAKENPRKCNLFKSAATAALLSATTTKTIRRTKRIVTTTTKFLTTSKGEKIFDPEIMKKCLESGKLEGFETISEDPVVTMEETSTVVEHHGDDGESFLKQMNFPSLSSTSDSHVEVSTGDSALVTDDTTPANPIAPAESISVAENERIIHIEKQPSEVSVLSTDHLSDTTEDSNITLTSEKDVSSISQSPNTGSLLVMESQDVKNLSMDKEEEQDSDQKGQDDEESESTRESSEEVNEATNKDKDSDNASLSKVVAFNSSLLAEQASLASNIGGTPSIMEQFNMIAKQSKGSTPSTSSAGNTILRFPRRSTASNNNRYMSQPVYPENRTSLMDQQSIEADGVEPNAQCSVQRNLTDEICPDSANSTESGNRMIFTDFLEPVPDTLEEESASHDPNDFPKFTTDALKRRAQENEDLHSSMSPRHYLRTSSAKLPSSHFKAAGLESQSDNCVDSELHQMIQMSLQRNTRNRSASGNTMASSNSSLVKKNLSANHSRNQSGIETESSVDNISKSTDKSSQGSVKRQTSEDSGDYHSPAVNSQSPLRQSSPQLEVAPTEITGAQHGHHTKHPISRSKSHFATLPAGIKLKTNKEFMDDTALPPAADRSEILQVSELQVKRNHIIHELINVETEYVKVLDFLVNGYMIPLKQERIIDDTQVDTIFYKVHEIYVHHASFLDQLKSWKSLDTIGDKIFDMFCRPSVATCYISFIENFYESEKTLENCWNAKSSFSKFVSMRQRESKSKLPLKALLVQPVQRIPRYELLIKRLKDYTPREYSDYNLLVNAEKAVHNLALKINDVREASQDEALIEGLKLLERLLTHVAPSSTRQYIRHDIVGMEDRKDAICVFMFSDYLVFTIMKRRGNTASKKPAVLRMQSPTGQDFVDNVKYKVIDRISIENLDTEANQDNECERQNMKNKEQQLKKDISLLEECLEICENVESRHQEIDDILNKMISNMKKELEETSTKASSLPPSPNAHKITILSSTKEAVDRFQLIFSSADKRTIWQNTLKEIKRHLTALTTTPLFYQTLQITRTRSGVQFSCAAAIEGFNNAHYRDVWICKTDGYTGHICLLSLQPEPIVTLNTPLAGCNSKITSVSAVPAYTAALKRTGSGIRRYTQNAADIIQTLSKSSRFADSALPNTSGASSSPSSKEASIPTNISSDSSSNGESSDNEEGDQTGDEASRKSSGNKDSEEASHLNKIKHLCDPNQATMWLGTEDGLVLIFPTTENLKTTRNRLHLQHNSGVLSQLYIDNKMFISLQNGEIDVYQRDSEGVWNFESPSVISISNQGHPIRKMVAVAGQIWCACQRDIIVLNPTTLKVERVFSIGNANETRKISLLCCSTNSVWISLEGSSRVYLYHATNYEFLCDLDTRQTVIQKLQHCDDIIQRHKEACLRITCMLTCKELLWIGTSAGVILTIQTPSIDSTTTRQSMKQPKMEGLDRGHTGHVRFVVSIENPPDHPNNKSGRRESLSPCTSMVTGMKVISGGDGYEDFSKSSANDVSDTGKDDSVNHLQIWDIH